MEEDAVDTGPGLEAQESWDYSHSPLLTDALAAMEAHAGRKSRPGSGPPALQRLDQGKCLSAASTSAYLLAKSAFTAWSFCLTTETLHTPSTPGLLIPHSNHSKQSDELHKSHVVSRQPVLLPFPLTTRLHISFSAAKVHVVGHAEYKPVANGVANGRIGHDDCLRPESEQQASTSRPHPATGDGTRVSDPGTSTLMAPLNPSASNAA